MVNTTWSILEHYIGVVTSRCLRLWPVWQRPDCFLCKNTCLNSSKAKDKPHLSASVTTPDKNPPRDFLRLPLERSDARVLEWPQLGFSLPTQFHCHLCWLCSRVWRLTTRTCRWVSEIYLLGYSLRGFKIHLILLMAARIPWVRLSNKKSRQRLKAGLFGWLINTAYSHL